MMHFIEIGIPVFVILLVLGLFYFLQNKLGFTLRTFIAVGLGIAIGLCFQFALTDSSISTIVPVFDLIANAYIHFLRMLVMPVIVIALLSVFVNLQDPQALGRVGFYVVGLLIVMTVLGGIIGLFLAKWFNLADLPSFAQASGLHLTDSLAQRVDQVKEASLLQKLVDMIPSNPFLDMTGARPNSVIAVVIFLLITGFAFLKVYRKNPESFVAFKSVVNALHDITIEIVRFVISLTPYGIFAIVARVILASHWQAMVHLIDFAVALYIAVGIVYVGQLILVAAFGLNPFIFLKKSFPVLAFSFASRSSAASIPLSIRVQTDRLGVPEGIAGLSASFVSVLGQVGCSGVYPAMLVAMVAPTVGIDPFSWSFLATFSLVLAVSSLGVAGVGGGAIFASIIILSTLGLPIEILAFLLAIDPIVDMARTALNVNGSMIASVVSSHFAGKLDMAIYNAPEEQEALTIGDI